MANETRTLTIATQYIKDLSFENPESPSVFVKLSKGTPEVTVNVDVTPQTLSDNTYEVVLRMRVEARFEETTAFLAELAYAGVIGLEEGLSAADTDYLLTVEAPRFLFPYARNILGVVTRDGGFPPLLINPIDFKAMKDSAAARQAQAGQANGPRGGQPDSAGEQSEEAG